VNEVSRSVEEHAEKFDLRHEDFAPFGDLLFDVYSAMRENARRASTAGGE
jgi:hypothetical protein